jgi:hypothetical protein
MTPALTVWESPAGGAVFPLTLELNVIPDWTAPVPEEPDTEEPRMNPLDTDPEVVVGTISRAAHE